MSDIKVSPGRMFVIRPVALGLSSVATWQMVPATDDCPTVAAEGGGLVVNPQKPGTYHGIAISDGKPVTFSVVCEAEQGGESLASKAWGKVKGAASVVGPLAKPVAKYGAMVALGVALTLGKTACDQKPNPEPIPVDPTPAPKPPAPVAKIEQAYVVICEDLTKRTPAQGKAVLYLEKEVVSKGHKFAFVSVKDPEYEQSGYRPFAEKAGLPAVVIIDQQHPSTVAATIKLDPAKWPEQLGGIIK